MLSVYILIHVIDFAVFLFTVHVLICNSMVTMV